MVTLTEQENLFRLIGEGLKEKTECFVIGGSAMMYYGAKDTTKDIDLVVLNEKDRNKILKILFSLNYTGRDTKLLYLKRKGDKFLRYRKGVPILVQRGDVKVDLFNKRVICFDLDDTIINRVKYVYEFENLIIKIVAPEDIILMKCATERKGDRADAAELIKRFNIDWNVVTEESKAQIKTEIIAPAFLYDFLLELKEDLKADIPEETITRLRKISEGEMIKALKKGDIIKTERL